MAELSWMESKRYSSIEALTLGSKLSPSFFRTAMREVGAV